MNMINSMTNPTINTKNATNVRNNRNLVATKKVTNGLTHALKNPWVKVEQAHSSSFYRDTLAKVCLKNQQQKRWVLCVDGDDDDVLTLADNIDKSKFLRVQGHHQPVAFDKIARALLKGNCSTVILNNPQLTDSQIIILHSCAKQGNTECIIVNKTQPNLH